MRSKSNKGFKFSKEILEEKDISKLRAKIKQINFSDNNITILALQPGLGKSFRTIFECNNLGTKTIRRKNEDGIFENKEVPKTAIVYNKNHKLLDMYEEQIPNSTHWRGFNVMCRNSECQEIYENFNITPNILCRKICKENTDCEYRAQFVNPQIALAYTGLIYMKRNDFDTIFIDENFFQVKEIKKNLIIAKSISNNFFKALKNNNAKWISDHRKMLNFKYDEILENFILNKQWKFVKEWTNFNINDQLFLAKNKIDVWYRPFLYEIFELAKNHSVVITCATFNEKFFRDMLKFYSSEIGFSKEIKIKLYESDIKNKNTKVIHINSEYAHRKNYSSYCEELFNILDKELTNDYKSIGKKRDEDKFELDLTFLNAEGSNIAEDSKILIKTQYFNHHIGEVFKEYQKFYMDFDIKEIPYNKDGDSLTDWIEKNTTQEYRDFEKFKDFSVNYDALHRNRGLIHNRIIINFGLLPNEIKKEFDVIEWDISSSKDLYELVILIKNLIIEPQE